MTDPLVALGTLWAVFPALHPAIAALAREIIADRRAGADWGGAAEVERWLGEREA